MIHGGAETAFGHKIDNYQSEKQRYTSTLDYYKKLEISYYR